MRIKLRFSLAFRGKLRRLYAAEHYKLLLLFICSQLGANYKRNFLSLGVGLDQAVLRLLKLDAYMYIKI